MTDTCAWTHSIAHVESVSFSWDPLTMLTLTVVAYLNAPHTKHPWAVSDWTERVSWRCARQCDRVSDSAIVIDELHETGKFRWMSQTVDEDEHSLEMHLPFTYKVFEEYVHIMSGQTDHSQPVQQQNWCHFSCSHLGGLYFCRQRKDVWPVAGQVLAGSSKSVYHFLRFLSLVLVLSCRMTVCMWI